MRTEAAAAMMLKVSRTLGDVADKLTDDEFGLELPAGFAEVAELCEQTIKTLTEKANAMRTAHEERLTARKEFGAKRHKAIVEGREY